VPSFTNHKDIIRAKVLKMGRVTLTMPFLRVVWFAILMLGLDIAYMHAKFEHSSFSRYGDMVGAHQNLNGSRDLTTPLSGIVCYPWASNGYDQPI